MLRQSADVVMVGGGIMGSMSALFLAQRLPEGNIVVVEKDPSYQYASTTLSAASFRHQFSGVANIRMGLFGTEFLRKASDTLAVAGERPTFGFQERGYLFLADSSEKADILKGNHARQCAEGADISLLCPEQVSQRYPWMDTRTVVAGTYGETGEGWFDAYSLLTAVKKKAQSLGVTYVKDEVVGVHMGGTASSPRAEAVQLASGQKIACGSLVNSSGASGARALTAMLDVTKGGDALYDLPVFPRKRCVFVFDARNAELVKKSPMVILPNGVFFRPEQNDFICGYSPSGDPDAYGDFEVDYEQFYEVVWPTIAGYVPAFDAIKLTGAWAGHYDYNTLDQNAVLGAHPAVGNFYFANGFSGHGLMQGPAAGRAISELIVDGSFQTLDLSVFCFERILRCSPEHELCIV